MLKFLEFPSVKFIIHSAIKEQQIVKILRQHWYKMFLRRWAKFLDKDIRPIFLSNMLRQTSCWCQLLFGLRPRTVMWIWMPEPSLSQMLRSGILANASRELFVARFADVVVRSIISFFLPEEIVYFQPLWNVLCFLFSVKNKKGF